MSELAGCRKRLEWAEAARQSFRTEVRAFFEGHPHRVSFAWDLERVDNFVAFLEPPETFPDHWGILLGDMFHNVRSALDNLAWLLATKSAGEPAFPLDRDWRKVTFPIHSQQNSFSSMRGMGGKFFRSRDWTYFETLQPFNPGRDNRILGVLSEMNNADKHRALHVVTAAREKLGWHDDPEPLRTVEDGLEVTVNVVNGAVAEYQWSPGPGVIREKTEIYRMIIHPTDPTQRTVALPEENVSLEVAIDHPLTQDARASDVVRDCIQAAERIVEHFDH